MSINFNSTKAQTKDGHLHTKYTYENSIVEKDASGNFNVTPTAVNYEFKLDLKVPKLVCYWLVLVVTMVLLF